MSRIIRPPPPRLPEPEPLPLVVPVPAKYLVEYLLHDFENRTAGRATSPLTSKAFTREVARSMNDSKGIRRCMLVLSQDHDWDELVENTWVRMESAGESFVDQFEVVREAMSPTPSEDERENAKKIVDALRKKPKLLAAVLAELLTESELEENEILKAK